MTVTILKGDCLAVMRKMPSNSVDICVTSPPYWGLRDYGIKGQMGQEPTLGEHLEVMVNVFREVRRILKPTGTCWINYGDCYATKPNGRRAADITGDDRTFRDKPFSTVGPIHRSKRIERGEGRWGGGNAPAGPIDDLKYKGRKGSRWRGAEGRDELSGGGAKAGGILKPKDLCMIPNRLAIALQEDGWWVRAENIWGKTNPKPDSVKDRSGIAHEKVWLLTKSLRYFYDYNSEKIPAKRAGDVQILGGRKALNAEIPKGDPRYRTQGIQWGRTVKTAATRHLRQYEPAPLHVWEMATKPFKGAHFATFPPELVARCIMAGCPQGGIVFDPFGGSGTTGLVADQLGLDCILIELNPEYIGIAEKRLKEKT